MRIEHINITVSDLANSVAFYSRLTGGRLLWEGITESGRRAAHVGDGQCYIALFEGARGERVPEDYDAPGFNHVGFEVDDLEDYRRRLDAMGVALKREESYDPGRRLYCYDPDGIEIELVAY